MFDYLFDHFFDRVLPRLIEHLHLVGWTLALALLIAFPLGLLISRVPPLAGPVLGLLGVVYTIPSLALFALLIPFLGLGTDTAVVGLVAYAQLALVRNIAVALRGVDPALLDAARGLGMTRGQRLWQVQLPLALPVILAGLRIATLTTISLATVAAWIGADGLGQILLIGVSQDNPPVIVAGVVCVGGMAITAEAGFRALEGLVGRRARRRAPAAPQETDLPVRV